MATKVTKQVKCVWDYINIKLFFIRNENNDFLISHEPFNPKKLEWKDKNRARIQMIAAEIFNVFACNIKPQ